MLEFPVSDYLQVANRFGQIVGSATALKTKDIEPDLLKDSITFLYEETVRLKLSVTHQQLSQMVAELAKKNPDSVTVSGKRMEIKGAALNMDRLSHYVESIYLTLTAELDSMLFKAISRDRNSFIDSSWLRDSPLVSAFPTAFKDLERSGICYALGQSTASVFHSMRALEPALAALAAPFAVSAQYENWQNIINDIESKVRALGQTPKTKQKIEDEKFFGAAVSHLYFIKNAWRNHVAHTRDSYSDDEALRVLQHSREFVDSLCPRLKEV